MTKLQYGYLVGSVILFVILYFGCDTKAPGHDQIETTRELSIETVNVQSLIKSAQNSLSSSSLSAIGLVEEELSGLSDTDTSRRIELLKQLSGRWYEASQPAIAGHYAEEIALLENNESAWSIAGTTYAICAQRSDAADVRSFCANRAAMAFQHAISFAPDDVSHQINLALTYTENPPASEPMKGILMLRELQTKFPENVSILNSLAKLALKTNQFDRALQRLRQAEALEPDNPATLCMLAKAYEGTGDQANATLYQQKCDRSTQ
jgi:tetratricopeptide (TPR) repeat protein